MNNTYAKNNFWLNKPASLFTCNNYYTVIPTQNMTYDEKLNSLTRLLIYLAVVCLILQFYSCAVIYPILLILLIIFMYLIYNCNSGSDTKKFSNMRYVDMFADVKPNTFTSTDTCTGTDANTNMCNMKHDDIEINGIVDNTQPQFVPVNAFTPHVRTMDAPMFGDDVIAKKNYERTFYSGPSNAYPPDTSKFAKWVFGSTASCKDQQSKCATKPYLNKVEF